MPSTLVERKSTDGPGAGKSTLLNDLAAMGQATVGESARAIVSERVASDLSPRPEPLALGARSFELPPWQATDTTVAERSQEFEQAVHVHAHIVASVRRYGPCSMRCHASQPTNELFLSFAP